MAGELGPHEDIAPELDELNCGEFFAKFVDKLANFFLKKRGNYYLLGLEIAGNLIGNLRSNQPGAAQYEHALIEGVI
jgi:hypothetical protein